MGPDVASGWDAAQRASARQLIANGLGTVAPAEAASTAPVDDPALTIDDRATRSIATFDRARATSGADAAGIVAIATPLAIARAPHATALFDGKAIAPGDGVTVTLSDRWAKLVQGKQLAARGATLFAALASDAGQTTGPLVVVPATRLAAIAGYIPARGAEPAHLIVNPVALAALEPTSGITTDPEKTGGGDTEAAAHTAAPTTLPLVDPTIIASTGGNPYSFYGSVAECAAAQRDRCSACINGGTGTCKPVTSEKDGTAECTALDADGGRGYYLLCINLSIAISSVEDCAASHAPDCPRVDTAASDLNQLNANADFLDMATCSTSLDGCLADIFGAPSGNFPTADGGTTADPPRSTEASCVSCSTGNCEASPTCSGPTCGNSFSCDSTCSSSTDQSGCGGNCDGCRSSGGGTGNNGGGCSSGGTSSQSSSGCGGGSSSSSGCSGNGDSCSSGNSSGCGGSSSSSGGSCGSSSSSSGCGGSGSGGSCGGSGSGGSCGGSSGGSSSSSGCGGSGGSSGGCSVARAEPDARVVLAVSVGWGFMPVPLAALIRRRARKKKKSKGEEVRS